MFHLTNILKIQSLLLIDLMMLNIFSTTQDIFIGRLILQLDILYLLLQNQLKQKNSYKMNEQNLQLKENQLRKNQSQKSKANESDDSSQSKKQSKKGQKRNSSERSRSRKKRRSRSKETKKKNKNKHRSRHHSSSSDSDRNRRRRSNSRQRKRSKDRKRKQFDRGRERQRYQGRNHHREYRPNNNHNNQVPPPIPAEMLMPILLGDRRKRQRSRSPLDYYRKNQNNNDGEFWDAFSWQPRINYTPNVSTSALANTKKMRRLMITKIPYQIGITQDNLRDLITRFMAQNYMKDQMNNCPVVNLQINQQEHNVAVELSSVQETCRMCRLQKIELFKGFQNGIIRLGDSIYGNSILTQAQTAGQAQAAAFAAINVLENKKTNFTIDSITGSGATTIIRVTNAVTPYMATHLTPQQWEDYHEDLIEGFSQYGKIVHNWFVTDAEKTICADAGNLFIQYEYKQNAQAAMSEMQNRLYDERSIKLYYWPRDLYYQNFRPDVTPPVLPPPLKTAKQAK